MKEIDLGHLFGYNMVLKDVPEERAHHVEKLAVAHLDKLNELYMKSIFGDISAELVYLKNK